MFKYKIDKSKIFLLLYTVIYLRRKQIFYRVYYTLRKEYTKLTKFSYKSLKCDIVNPISMAKSIPALASYKNNSFIFLNANKQFGDSVDWNFNEYGKLWLYNLNYFDYLQQPDMSKDEGLKLIYSFIDNSEKIKDGMMPFPISLRGVNWIKFLSHYSIEDEKINNSLYSQYYKLLDNLEYHILGNHLLENGFSLLFGAYYFEDKRLHDKAREILFEELNEQVLNDGAHFELSPMYHQIMLYRVLDCINLLQNNFQHKDKDLLIFINKKASLMLGWLDIITFQNGTIPYLNDSAQDIAPASKEIFEYANRLNIATKKITLKDSGYRKFRSQNYECIVDVGNIGPDYIPGHAHADTFNFVLHVNKKPLIVDTGLSTYETNERRNVERATSSHNTVEIDGENQSEVWGGFRVARRAKIVNIVESSNYVKATHDGFKRIGAMHTRKFIFEDNRLKIEDIVESNKNHECISYLHFYPNTELEIIDNKIICDGIIINVENCLEIEKENYYYSEGFNKLKEAEKLKIYFKKNLKMEIKI